MQTQTQRRDEILRVVRSQQVHSQEELLEILETRGFEVTQPTLSRDLREMGVVKTPNGYAEVGEIAPPIAFAPSKFESVVRSLVVSAVPAGTVVVVKTPAAEAQPVALAIDAAGLDGVAGTLGGDDTVFVACTSSKAAAAVAKQIHSILGTPALRRRARA
ncbi:MAG: arginine repressor [Thermoanaerobaculia bacterium]